MIAGVAGVTGGGQCWIVDSESREERLWKMLIEAAIEA